MADLDDKVLQDYESTGNPYTQKAQNFMHDQTATYFKFLSDQLEHFSIGISIVKEWTDINKKALEKTAKELYKIQNEEGYIRDENSYIEVLKKQTLNYINDINEVNLKALNLGTAHANKFVQDFSTKANEIIDKARKEIL